MLDQEEIEQLLRRLEDTPTGPMRGELQYVDEFDCVFSEDDVRLLVKLYRDLCEQPRVMAADK